MSLNLHNQSPLCNNAQSVFFCSGQNVILGYSFCSRQMVSLERIELEAPWVAHYGSVVGGIRQRNCKNPCVKLRVFTFSRAWQYLATSFLIQPLTLLYIWPTSQDVLGKLLQPPSEESINDAIKRLHNIGALDTDEVHGDVWNWRIPLPLPP